MFKNSTNKFKVEELNGESNTDSSPTTLYTGYKLFAVNYWHSALSGTVRLSVIYLYAFLNLYKSIFYV